MPIVPEEEHPNVLAAKSIYYMSKNLKRIADSLDEIVFLVKAQNPNYPDMSEPPFVSAPLSFVEEE